MTKYKIDRTLLPYDAFVNDPAWLLPYEENDDEERENSDIDAINNKIKDESKP